MAAVLLMQKTTNCFCQNKTKMLLEWVMQHTHKKQKRVIQNQLYEERLDDCIEE